MTVCVAAICDQGTSCVVAADRMGVYGQGLHDEFSLDDTTNKVHELNSRAILLHSGATRDVVEILSRFKKSKGTGPIAQRIDEIAAEIIADRRTTTLKRLIGDALDYKALTEKAITLTSGFLFDTWQTLQKYDAGHMIVVTKDNGQCQLHLMYTPAEPTIVELNYFAIGTGGRYARAALTIQQYSKTAPITEAMFQVYSAKRAAEMVYGVGKPTDMGILHEGGFQMVQPETLELLEQYRQQRSRFLLNQEQSEHLQQSLALRSGSSRKKGTKKARRKKSGP